ncbi:MAG TPA: hypothetical protein VGM54_01940 [Chthoniobacter sp.]|jgi:hypothetical protein
MKFLRAALVVMAAVCLLTGCIQVEEIVKLKPDGSGTIEETVLIPKAALAMMRQMAGNGGKPLDLFDEAKLKQAAVKMGDGVTYVSGKKVSTDAGEGFTAVYSFTDANQLKLNPNLADSMPGANASPDKDRKVEWMRFHFAKGNPAEVTLTMPPPTLNPNKAAKSNTVDDGALQMMEQMLKDLKMTFAVETEGTISETNAAYHDGGRVTLLDVDFNKVLADPEKFKALAKANPQSMQEAKALLKEIDGLKVETSPEVKIKFQ